MTDNERISKWLGECRHQEYDSDLSAWTPAFYQKIEDAGLIIRFIEHIETGELRFGAFEAFQYLKATPPQKATALSRAIESEVKDATDN